MKIKKKSGSKAENLRNLKAQPKQLVPIKKEKKKSVVINLITFAFLSFAVFGPGGKIKNKDHLSLAEA